MSHSRKKIERCDIRDRSGRKTGRTAVRGAPLQPGEYRLAVHVWVRDDSGRFLIQKRAPHVVDPDIWAPTCGSVVQGEESLQAAVRELREELGLRVAPGEMESVKRLVGPDSAIGPHAIVDIWRVHRNVPVEEIHFPDGEVSAVKWATREEIRDLMAADLFPAYGPNYLEPILG